MSKLKTTLRFTSLTNLWAFRLASEVNQFEMNLAELSITCECSKEIIEVAVKEFNGKVFTAEKEEV